MNFFAGDFFQKNSQFSQLVCYGPNLSFSLGSGYVDEKRRDFVEAGQPPEGHQVGVAGQVGVDDAPGLGQQPLLGRPQKGLVVAAQLL